MKLIIGIDEVARGCLAGPVMSAAVVLNPDILSKWSDINNISAKVDLKTMSATVPRLGCPCYITDSKKMTSSNRQLARKWIIETAALYWSLGESSATEIDTINIRNATFLAMNRALSAIIPKIQLDYPTADVEIIVDGNAFISMPEICIIPAHYVVKTVIKADLHVPSVACASIVAKETRDEYIDRLAASIPDELDCYGWNTNRAYGTTDHFRAILLNGISTHHRLTFIGKILEPS